MMPLPRLILFVQQGDFRERAAIGGGEISEEFSQTVE